MPNSDYRTPTALLIDFLLARVAERETKAVDSPDRRYELRECEMKRLLIRLHHPVSGDLTFWRTAPMGLRILALPEQDHPDFRPEWMVGASRVVAADRTIDDG